MSPALRVCVVGAGAAGLTATKALRDRGISVSCYERGDRIGGLWAFGNRGGNPTAYRSLQMNTSRARSAFAGLPMDGDPRGFARHEEVAAYLERYADAFGLREHIHLGTRGAGGGSRSGRRLDGDDAGRRAAALRRTRGRQRASLGSQLPAASGGGALRRAHPARGRLRRCSGLAGADVVVVGLGNSAMDIAVEISATARRTMLSARRGVHILPRHVGGRPLDQLELPIRRYLPSALAGPVVGLVLRAWLARPGRRPQDHGLPAPAQAFGSVHPTLSDEIFGRLDAGAISAARSVREGRRRPRALRRRQL